MACHEARGALVSETFWALSSYGLASPVLECWAYGNTFFVDHPAVLPSVISATICTVSAVDITFYMFLFDFGLAWWCSLCIGVVVYSGSYLRNIPSGIVRIVLSGNAAITIQELIGVGNSGLYLETR